MTYIRIPRRFRYDDEEEEIFFKQRPRTRRRRRRTKVTPDLDELIDYVKSQLEALEKYQNEMKEKHKPKENNNNKNKIPYPTGLAITFFLAPFIWGIGAMLLYSFAKTLTLGHP